MGFGRPGDNNWTAVAEGGRGAHIIGLDEGEKKRLLVVIRHAMVDEYFSQETYKSKRFLLFAYDLKDGKWSRMKDFGRKTLFVEHGLSFWIEDTKGAIIKNNCIYFTMMSNSYTETEVAEIWEFTICRTDPLSLTSLENHGVFLPLQFGFNPSKLSS
nr:hypothetical protein [Tanacetum cinerariifolium]